MGKVALLGVGLAAGGLYAAGCIAIAVLAGRARGRLPSMHAGGGWYSQPGEVAWPGQVPDEVTLYVGGEPVGTISAGQELVPWGVRRAQDGSGQLGQLEA